MPEFLRLLAPQQARERLFSSLGPPTPEKERLETADSLDRVTAEDLLAPHPLPEFPRSTVDGYAVIAADTHGATESLPAYLQLIGEVSMGVVPESAVGKGQCLLIHTGGMLPARADAVIMLEYTQIARAGDSSPVDGSTDGSGTNEIEVLRAVAAGENVIQVGEDVKSGQIVISRGTRLGPAEIGGLMALGLTSLSVVRKPRIALISCGDEIVPPHQRPHRGQVRDVNAYTLASVITRWGGEAVSYGIVPDDPAILEKTARRALLECESVIITAGSSASARDQTANVIDTLGKPGVLVHGVNTRPGKPTILGACDGKAVLGLPGNPVSALVNAYLFVLPVVERLLGLSSDQPRPTVAARLTINLASQAGREDWWPVKLRPGGSTQGERPLPDRPVNWVAEPIFGRSNLIFTLAAADGLLSIPADLTGLAAGAEVEVLLI